MLYKKRKIIALRQTIDHQKDYLHNEESRLTVLFLQEKKFLIIKEELLSGYQHHLFEHLNGKLYYSNATPSNQNKKQQGPFQETKEGFFLNYQCNKDTYFCSIMPQHHTHWCWRIKGPNKNHEVILSLDDQNELYNILTSFHQGQKVSTQN